MESRKMAKRSGSIIVLPYLTASEPDFRKRMNESGIKAFKMKIHPELFTAIDERIEELEE